MKSQNKSNPEIWNLLETLLKERCLSMTIKKGDSTIVVKVKGNSLITEVYERGSLLKVNHHLANSGKELIAALEEMGICVWSLFKKLAVLKFWKRGNKPLCLEFQPKLLK